MAFTTNEQLKQFAIVARATSSLYLYKALDENGDFAEDLVDITPSYFKSKDLTGYVKIGDVIIITAHDGVRIAYVSAVDETTGQITIAYTTATTASATGTGD